METMRIARPNERTWRDYVVAWRLINGDWEHGWIENVFDHGVDWTIKRVQLWRRCRREHHRLADELLAVLSRPVEDWEQAKPVPAEDWERDEPQS